MLSGRVQFIRGATLTGQLLTNGRPRDQADFANISAYVTQDDNLYGQLVRSSWGFEESRSSRSVHDV